MDAKARNKALFRAKLSAVNKDKRIDSPLVRYNESDQPICRVCDVVLKSEAQWDAHQASRKHKEAIDNFKASAAAAKQNGAPQKESAEPRRQGPLVGHVTGEGSDRRPTPAAKASSGLPPGFFDGDVQGGAPAKPVSTKKLGEEATVSPYNGVQQPRNGPSVSESNETAKPLVASDKRPAKGALPEGFFDNKEADLRARGIQPVKERKQSKNRNKLMDPWVEYKEFEKSIQEDLQEVDNRMEEEEIDAAEFIEEAESIEQKTYQERVEMLRKKKLELAVNKSAKRRKGSEEVGKRTIQEESSSDDDADEDFAVDWRAQHI